MISPLALIRDLIKVLPWGIMGTIIGSVSLFVSFLKYRDIKKPILTTKVIPYYKRMRERAEVRENTFSNFKGLSDSHYFVVSNESDNKAKNIEVVFEFELSGETVRETYGLDYLNPKECAKFPVPREKVLERFPNLFEKWWINEYGSLESTEDIDKTQEEVETSKILPKENLRVNYEIRVKWGGLLKYFNRIKDTYEMNWLGFDRSLKPNFKDMPIISSVHKRDGHPINKVD